MSSFIDSYALIAWLNHRDSAHETVSEYLADFQRGLVTTEWVLMEVADALSATANRKAVVEFLDTIRSDSRFDVVGYEQSAYQNGFALFRRRSDKDWSLTDCISFGVMTTLGLTEALTGDKHFTQAGFHAVFAVATS